MKISSSRARAAVVIALAWQLAGARSAIALNPALEVNQYAHSAWTIRDGFFKGQIRSITQTADGYLWLATEFGLVRFDGVKAVNWEPSSDQHLPSSDIWSVLASRDGSVWIGTAKGLARWKGGKLTQYPELSGHFVQRIYEDRTGTVWATGGAVPVGVLCAVRERDIACSKDGTFGFGPFGLYEDRKGNLWVGVRGGLLKWRPEPRVFFPAAGTNQTITDVVEDTNGALLFAGPGGVYRVVSNMTKSYPTNSGRPWMPQVLLRDRDGSLWIGTLKGGLIHVHQQRTDQFGPADGLSGRGVMVLFQDREGNIWVSTENGLDRFREVAVPRFSAKQGLGTQDAIAAASDGGIWMASADGVAKWINGDLLTYRARGAHGTKPAAGTLVASELPGGTVANVFEDDRHRIWLASQTAFGYVRDDRFVEVPDVSARRVRAIVEDAEANIWVSDEQLGLFRVSDNGPIERTPWSAFGRTDFATTMAPDRQHGGVWLGFFNGGVAYVEDGKVRASYGPADGLTNGWVKGLLIADGALWIAAEGGLSRLHDGRMATLTSRNGLPCDAVNWVIQDDAGALWLNMACGLVQITRTDVVAWANGRAHSIAPTVFDAADGVRSQSVPTGYSPYVAKAADGRLWFVGLDGASVIDPFHLPFNTQAPPVHIETLIADRQAQDVTSEGNPPIRLPALTRDLEIDYTALSLVVPESNRFKVKLEGWDREWQDQGNQRQKYYSNLPPRTYRFRVIASNNSGVWNEAGTYLDFTVDPAYYQTTWFRAAIIGTALLLLIAVYRLRVRQVAHRYNLRLEERVNERIRIARDLHDTLLQSFHAVVLQFRAATYLLPDRPEDAKKTLDGVIDDASKAIVDARNAVQGLRASTDPATTVVDAIAALAKELEAENASQSRPEFILHVEGTPGILQPLVRDDVYRIAREAMRNAFHHSGAGRIEVDVRYDRRQFRLRIRDDGKGIDDKVAALGSRPGHYGLSGMRERAELIGGTFTLWSELGSGTEIELTIPSSIAYAK